MNERLNSLKEISERADRVLDPEANFIAASRTLALQIAQDNKRLVQALELVLEQLETIKDMCSHAEPQQLELCDCSYPMAMKAIKANREIQAILGGEK